MVTDAPVRRVPLAADIAALLSVMFEVEEPGSVDEVRMVDERTGVIRRHDGATVTITVAQREAG